MAPACACRGQVVHFDCLVQVALAKDEAEVEAGHHGSLAFIKCATCHQEFTGAAGVELLRIKVARTTASLGAGHAIALDFTAMLGQRLNVQGQLAEAEQRLRQAWAGQLRLSGGRDTPQTLEAAGLLATVLEVNGNLPGAESMQRNTLKGKEKVYGLSLIHI